MNIHIDDIWFSFTPDEKKDLQGISSEMREFIEKNCEFIPSQFEDFYSLTFKEESEITDFLTILKESEPENEIKDAFIRVFDGIINILNN